MSFISLIREYFHEKLSSHSAVVIDTCLKKSAILALFAQHMHVLGERLNLHTAAIKRLGEHSADLQRQVDLMRQSVELIVQAKSERLIGTTLGDSADEMPN